MSNGVVIIGAGGHGREVYAALDEHMLEWGMVPSDHADKVTFLGFIDDNEPDVEQLDRLGARWLGPVSALAELPTGTRYLIGIGSGEVRRKIDQSATELGLEPFTLVDPSASVGPDVRLSPGAIVFGQATVTTNVTIGRHAHVGRGVAIGHDSTLADYASAYPNASVSGNVRIGERATIGTGAAVRQGSKVAPGAMVGAGAVVVSDVAGTVMGVPAR